MAGSHDVSEVKLMMCPAMFSKNVVNREHGTICHPLTYSWVGKENAPDYVNVQVQNLQIVGKPIYNQWIRVSDNLGKTIQGPVLESKSESKRGILSYEESPRYTKFTVIVSKTYPNAGFVHVVLRTEPENFNILMKVVKISKSVLDISNNGIEHILARRSLYNENDNVKREHASFDRKLNRILRENAFEETQISRKVADQMTHVIEKNTEYTFVRNKLSIAVEEQEKADMDNTIAKLATNLKFLHLYNPFSKKQ